jgi:hypothetical protein
VLDTRSIVLIISGFAVAIFGALCRGYCRSRLKESGTRLPGWVTIQDDFRTGAEYWQLTTSSHLPRWPIVAAALCLPCGFFAPSRCSVDGALSSFRGVTVRERCPAVRTTPLRRKPPSVRPVVRPHIGSRAERPHRPTTIVCFRAEPNAFDSARRAPGGSISCWHMT